VVAAATLGSWIERDVTGPGPSTEMPHEFEPRVLARRALEVILLLGVLVLAAELAPGLGDVRRELSHAQPGWLAVAGALEALSGCSYVLMFRPVFCRRLSWRTTWELSWSELAVGSIVPASGAGGLALGAWILRRGGMSVDRIARRSVAFFLLKSSVNFVAVAVIGVLMATHLVGPDRPWWQTAAPAAAAVLAIAVVLALPRLGEGRAPEQDAGRVHRWSHAARRGLIGGVTEAIVVARARDPLLLVGALGYWAFHAVGVSPSIWVILMGYLIGQLGGALPLPGGVGGIDGGLIGTLVVFGVPAAATTAAVLAYRVILFWLPLVVGGFAFWALRRGVGDPGRNDLFASEAPG